MKATRKTRIWLIGILLLAFSFVGSSQEICVGSLGENIFTEGDFGSGQVNILPTDPGIAPGFIYTTNAPFDDGFYTITNGSDRWNSNFDTWLNIGDASNDPNGYMMVVNASFQPGIFYEQEVTGLCDNTTYNFTADVINFIKQPVTGHILPNVSFLIDGVVEFTTGPIPQDEKWHNYGFSFVTEPGQTTVVLTLRNNAPGGIGNDLALDNISFRACGPDAITSTDLDGKVCENSTENVFLAANIQDAQPGYALQWQVSSDNGGTWTDIPGAMDSAYQITDFSSGSFLYRYLFGASPANLLNPKCRTLSTPLPIEVIPLTWSISDTICSGTTYQFGDTILDRQGIYVDSLISSIGCDSIVTLNLVEVPADRIGLNITATDPSCTDFRDGSISLVSVTGAWPPVTYQINDSEVDLSVPAAGLGSDTYVVSVTDRFRCTADTLVDLVNPDAFLPLGRIDTTIKLGQPITLVPQFTQQPESWQWSPSEGLSCTDCPDPVIRPLRTTNYSVLAKNANGCEATYNINVDVFVDNLVFIPNIFTPNRDNINDRLTVFGDANAQTGTYEISIYDRFGSLVYQNPEAILNEEGTGWDGTSGGDPAPTGVYTYLIRFELINGQIIQRAGSITLIR